MGQRSQLYIRYKNGKNLVAMHLQWNWGYYMINRTYQLLNYIDKNVKINFSNFKEEDFNIANSESRRDDIDILQHLIQINLTMGSYVGGVDLIKEKYNFFNKDKRKTFKINPNNQDNNNGILVIDIKEDGKVKYGLAGGCEETGSWLSEFEMISARKYFELSEEDYKEEHKLKNKDKKLYEVVQKQIEFIDRNFELLTNEEYKEIFNQEYEYSNCLKKEV